MAIIKDRLSYVRGLPLNRYRLVLGLIVIIGVILAYIYNPLNQRLNFTKTSDNANAQDITFSVESVQPTLNTPTLPLATTATSTSNSGIPLEALFNEMTSIFRELMATSTLMTNPLNLSQAPDEATIQLYQPQIEKLQQRFTQLQQRAFTLSKADTQRFFWNLLVETNFPTDNSHLLLSNLADADDTLLNEMFALLSSGAYTLETRQTLAYNLLLPQRNTDMALINLQQSNSLSPRQLRLKQFLEEQLLSEPDGRLLATYMEIYHTWANEGQLTTKEAFKQQLDAVRTQLAPDQYFGFRLQTLNLSDPNADYAGLLADISATAMDKQLKRNLLLRLADEISTRLTGSSDDATAPNGELPETTRQLLIHYLQTNLPQPQINDGYTLYQYGTQVYTLLLLMDRSQAVDKLYQRIVSSTSLAEQLGMLSALPMTDGIAQKNLREHTHLRQTLEQALTQPNLSSEARTSIASGLSSLMLQPPTVSTASQTPNAQGTASVDEQGNPMYSVQSSTNDDSTQSINQTMPYSNSPAVQ